MVGVSWTDLLWQRQPGSLACHRRFACFSLLFCSPAAGAGGKAKCRQRVDLARGIGSQSPVLTGYRRFEWLGSWPLALADRLREHKYRCCGRALDRFKLAVVSSCPAECPNLTDAFACLTKYYLLESPFLAMLCSLLAADQIAGGIWFWHHFKNVFIISAEGNKLQRRPLSTRTKEWL